MEWYWDSHCRGLLDGASSLGSEATTTQHKRSRQQGESQ